MRCCNCDNRKPSWKMILSTGIMEDDEMLHCKYRYVYCDKCYKHLNPDNKRTIVKRLDDFVSFDETPCPDKYSNLLTIAKFRRLIR